MRERAYRSTAYIWFDAEYSSLDLESAVFLQIAAVATDPDLERLFPPDDDLRLFIRLDPGRNVSPWLEENAPQLLEICRSQLAVCIEEADARLAALVSRINVPGGEEKRRPILAGNSIHADWRLACKYLPRFVSLLHYRHLDVTALKLQWQDWRQGPEFDKDDIELVRSFLPGPKHLLDGRRHDAYYDVLASIAELNYYRHQFLAR
ncbi:MAG: exonuclease domain-containing protein [Kiritimatiellae bacterium]|nr:exonuclease domain-containing protein [Kiritimatiellia bacterium]MDW8459025.1 exonuclease domain-containing protein [Verrucomicrobiota bacterium]